MENDAFRLLFRDKVQLPAALGNNVILTTLQITLFLDYCKDDEALTFRSSATEKYVLRISTFPEKLEKSFELTLALRVVQVLLHSLSVNVLSFPG